MMYNQMFCIFLLCIGIMLIKNGSQANPENERQSNPGIAVKATTKGLNAVKDLMADYLEIAVLNKAIEFGDRVSVKILFWTQSISYSGRFQITSFNIGSPVVQVSPPNIFKISTSGAHIALSGSIEAFGLNLSLSPIVNGVSTTLTIAVRQDNRGRPTFSSESCQIDADSLNLNFDGAFSVLNDFSEQMKNFVFDKACNQVENLIKENAEKITSSLNPDIPFLKDFSFELGNIKNITNLNLNLDLAMNRPMNFTTRSVTAYGVGSVYCPSTNSDKVFNFRAPPLPPLSTTNQMVLCSISRYLANTMSYTLWSKGIFTFSFSLQQIIDASGMDKETLISTLSQSSDEANIFLQLFFNEPQQVFVDVGQSQAPFTSFSLEGFFLNTETEINITSPLVSISLSVNLNVTGKVYFESDYMKMKISDLSAAVTSNNPLIQELLTQFNDASPIFMPVFVAAVNNLLENFKYELPLIYGFKLSNLTIEYKENAAEISTDFQYLA